MEPALMSTAGVRMSSPCSGCASLDTTAVPEIGVITCAACGQATLVIGRDGAGASPLPQLVRWPQSMDRYRPQRVLGRGSYGTVYLAARGSDGARVAVKILRRVDLADARQRFRRECELLAQVVHPNVVQVLESAEVDGWPFLVTQYVSGGSLRERMRRGPLPAAEAVRIAGGVLAGLAACHARGIIHRDLKPENILLGTKGAQLADFGLAKVVDDPVPRLTQAGTLLGTPAYMSLQQLTGEEVGRAADIHALGVILHEMLAGRTPYTLASLTALIAEKSRPVQLEGIRLLGLAPQLLALVESALSPDPAQRPRSAEAMAAELRRADPGRAVVARTPAPVLGELPDEQLMVHAAQGEAPAFEELVHRHRDRAWRIACAVIGDPIEAEDIVQSAFMRIANHLRDYRPEGAFLGYFRCVVSRLCQDHFRKNAPALVEDMGDVPFGGSSAGTKLDRQQRAQIVRAALAELPPQQRMAVVLRYFERMPAAEIGRALGVTPKAVERLLARGRRALAALLEGGLA